MASFQSLCGLLRNSVFSGCDFVFENITTLHLKSTEAGLYVENTSFKKKC